MNKQADDGNIFVCGACGKVSTWAYGFDDNNKSTATRGWDESCMLNAVEVPLDKVIWNEAKTHCLINSHGLFSSEKV